MKIKILVAFMGVMLLAACSKSSQEGDQLTFEDIEEEFAFYTPLTDYSKKIILERFISVEEYRKYLESFESNKYSKIDEVVDSVKLKSGGTYVVDLVPPIPYRLNKLIFVDEDENIMEAAWAYGIELPYSCLAGACSTCASKIIEGQVDVSEGSLISLDEYHEGGWFSLCIAYPLSDCKILTEKEEEYLNWEY